LCGIPRKREEEMFTAKDAKEKKRVTAEDAKDAEKT
jgi:hypothetical protein